MPDGNGGGIIKELVDAGFGYLWFGLLAIWGGTVNYISRVKRKDQRFSIVELIGEWTISAFAGIITALICSEMGLTIYMTSALAGISGHMGGRAIYIAEHTILTRMGMTQYNRRADDPKDPEDDGKQ